MNLIELVFFFFFFFLVIYPGMELLDHMVLLFLVFGGTSTVAAPIYIPINNVQGFLFLYLLANI